MSLKSMLRAVPTLSVKRKFLVLMFVFVNVVLALMYAFLLFSLLSYWLDGQIDFVGGFIVGAGVLALFVGHLLLMIWSAKATAVIMAFAALLSWVEWGGGGFRFGMLEMFGMRPSYHLVFVTSLAVVSVMNYVCFVIDLKMRRAQYPGLE